jgi:hypothetical protein
MGHIVWLDEHAFDLVQVNNATQADHAPVIVPLPPSIPRYATMLVMMLHIMETTGLGAELYVMPGDIPTPTPTLYFGAESGPAGFWDKHWGMVRIGANRAIQYQVTWVAAGASGNMRLRILGYSTP